MQGLGSAEAERRLVKFGQNLLVKERRGTLLGIAREEVLEEPMILLFPAVGVLYSIWGEQRDAGVPLYDTLKSLGSEDLVQHEK
jgi:hypothetical protein